MRFILPAPVHAIVLSALFLSLGPKLPASPPNVILIYADDLGYNDLGCYGSVLNDTPHLDRLAEEGMRFTSYYSASSVCTPSRAALMTGCYPERVNFGAFGPESNSWVLFPGFAEGLHPQELIMPEFFKARGYSTCHIGKWHLGDQPEHLPTRHGFDSYFGIPYSNDMAIMPRRPNSPPLPLLRNEEVIQEQPKQAPLIERYTEESVRFIRSSHQKGEPFFLYLAHLHVHLPHYVMDPFLSKSRNGRYGAAVAAIDWSTGVLVAELERLGLAENTIIIFTSDNGSRARGEGGSNRPLRGHKGQTWEAGMRVPCIVKWPGQVPAGSVSDHLVTAMDFYPTLAGLAGYELPAEPARDGHNVLPIWQGAKHAKSPYETFFYFRKEHLQAVRMGEWKLRYAYDKGDETDPDRAELFNLGDDIGETTDLAAQYPTIVEKLAAAMDSIREALGDARLGLQGNERRPEAISVNPQPLTTFDPNYPYIEPSYDLNEAG